MDITKIQEMWHNNGLLTKIVDAPKDASTFDKMLIVYADKQCKIIRKVSLYSTKDKKFVLEY